jgi:hypothetical protein
LLLWLVIGAAAAGQRGFYSLPSIGCSQAATIVATFVAGPLNYVGVDPTINCKLPSPSNPSSDPPPAPSPSVSPSHAGGIVASSH